MFNKKNRTPLLVEVTNSEWHSFGDPNSFHHKFLHTYLTRKGGVNASVQPGYYNFDIKRVGFELEISLLPANV